MHELYQSLKNLYFLENRNFQNAWNLRETLTTPCFPAIGYVTKLRTCSIKLFPLVESSQTPWKHDLCGILCKIKVWGKSMFCLLPARNLFECFLRTCFWAGVFVWWRLGSRGVGWFARGGSLSCWQTKQFVSTWSGQNSTPRGCTETSVYELCSFRWRRVLLEGSRCSKAT